MPVFGAAHHAPCYNLVGTDHKYSPMNEINHSDIPYTGAMVDDTIAPVLPSLCMFPTFSR